MDTNPHSSRLSGAKIAVSFTCRFRDIRTARGIGVSNYCPRGALNRDGVYPGQRRRAAHITTLSRWLARYRRGLGSAAKVGDSYARLSTGLIPSRCAGRRIDTRLRAVILALQEECGRPGGLEQENLQNRMVCACTHRPRGWMHPQGCGFVRILCCGLEGGGSLWL
jgi:hypothetical protein